MKRQTHISPTPNNSSNKCYSWINQIYCTLYYYYFKIQKQHLVQIDLTFLALVNSSTMMVNKSQNQNHCWQVKTVAKIQFTIDNMLPRLYLSGRLWFWSFELSLPCKHSIYSNTLFVQTIWCIQCRQEMGIWSNSFGFIDIFLWKDFRFFALKTVNIGTMANLSQCELE